MYEIKPDPRFQPSLSKELKSNYWPSSFAFHSFSVLDAIYKIRKTGTAIPQVSSLKNIFINYYVPSTNEKLGFQGEEDIVLVLKRLTVFTDTNS